MNVNIVKTTRLSKDLLACRENTDFPQLKPRQLPSAKAKFEGWSSDGS